MKQRKPERRSLPTPGDRRSKNEETKSLHWDDAPPAGAIRPGVNEPAPTVERRRYPDSGE